MEDRPVRLLHQPRGPGGGDRRPAATTVMGRRHRSVTFAEPADFDPCVRGPTLRLCVQNRSVSMVRELFEGQDRRRQLPVSSRADEAMRESYEGEREAVAFAANPNEASDRIAVAPPYPVCRAAWGLSVMLGVATSLTAGAAVGSKNAADSKGAKVFASARLRRLPTHSRGRQVHRPDRPEPRSVKPTYDAVVRQSRTAAAACPVHRQAEHRPDPRMVARFVAASTKNNSVALTRSARTMRSSPTATATTPATSRPSATSPTTQSPETALSTLARTLRTNQAVDNGCHQIAHEIGHAAYVKYHDNAAVSARERLDDVLVRLLPRTSSSAPSAASRARSVRLDRARPLHRRGDHEDLLPPLPVRARPRARADDLQPQRPALLAPCLRPAQDQLGTRTLCTGGVFMQNFLPGPMQLTPTRW
jgi:hypothetical protein